MTLAYLWDNCIACCFLTHNILLPFQCRDPSVLSSFFLPNTSSCNSCCPKASALETFLEARLVHSPHPICEAKCIMCLVEGDLLANAHQIPVSQKMQQVH